MATLATGLLRFYRDLQPPPLPRGIDWLYPQRDKAVLRIVKTFLQQYFSDKHPRRLVLGINPGRFGAGITGVNFTAPRQLTEDCGIDHPLGKGTELSAEFIYRVIRAYGGAETFYHDWFIGAVCPLGFIRQGININYYDDRRLLKAVRPFIVTQLDKLIRLGFETDRCVCVGGDKNYRFLCNLNEQHQWFGEIIPLPHPRYIMQYRSKQAADHVARYISALRH